LIKLLLSFLLGTTLLFASNPSCEETLFTFDVTRESGNVRILDIIENVAHECHFSVRITDEAAKKVLNTPLFLVHIKDYTLENIFNFLFTQHNMFYTFDEHKNVLTLSYLKTRSFIIDYINLTEHSTDSTKTITVGAASLSNRTSGGSGYGSQGGGNSNNRQNSSNADYTTVISKSKFEFWDKLNNEIDTILSRDGDHMQIESKSIINREAGIVTITGTKSQIDRVSSYLSTIKKRLHKQVMLETKVFELRYSNKESTGVDWSKFNLSLKGDTKNLFNNIDTESSYSFSYQFSMDGLIDFLNQYGNLSVLSAPKILTLNNQPAVINVGNQINYRYESGSVSTTNVGASTSNTYLMSSVFIGLTLNIIPEITDDGFVILRINPVISEELDASDTLNGNRNSGVDAEGIRVMPPDIKIKQLSSIVKAKNGSRVVIGGLISTTKQNIDSSIPLLSSIPLMGGLFQHTSTESFKTELIIVVTPKIIDYNNFPSIDNIEQLLEESHYE